MAKLSQTRDLCTGTWVPRVLSQPCHCRLDEAPTCLGLSSHCREQPTLTLWFR